MNGAESYIVMIASNRGGREFKFVISHGWIKAAIYLSFVALLFVCTAAVDYFGLGTKVRENTELVSENRALKERRSIMEKSLSSLQVELERVHNLTTKLKIITRMGSDLMPVAPEREPASIPLLTDGPGEAPTGDVKIPAALAPLPMPELSGLSLPLRVEQALQDSQLREQELMNTWGLLSDRQSLLSAMPSIKPANGYYSSPFGYRFDPINGRPLLHAGLDIAAPWGTQVLAPADGVISFAGYEGGYGNLVAIDHGYGVTTRFGHNSKLFVHQGQRVRRWEVISLVGSTGHSTGAHVHYEVRVHGLPVDPINYILQEN